MACDISLRGRMSLKMCRLVLRMPAMRRVELPTHARTAASNRAAFYGAPVSSPTSLVQCMLSDQNQVYLSPISYLDKSLTDRP
jgi:hypothetical protein